MSNLGILDLANAVRVANKTEAQDALLAYLAEHPDASLAEAGTISAVQVNDRGLRA